MAISLNKGGRLSLSKEAPDLKKALIGLGWDPVPPMAPLSIWTLRRSYWAPMARSVRRPISFSTIN